MEHTHIPLHNEVDGNTLTAEAARVTDAMNVNFRFLRQIVIDDQPAHLPHVDTVIHVIGGDEHTGRPTAELLRDELALLVYLAELMDSLPSLVADSNATVAMEALSLDFGDDDAVRYEIERLLYF